MTMLWPLARTPRRSARPDPGDPGFPAFVLRTSPVLLLSGPPADGTDGTDATDSTDGAADDAVARLLREWNPLAVAPQVADGVRWSGPFRLDAASSAKARLPGGWSTAYAAQAARSRTRVPDGLDAPLVRLRYPDGLPTGAEAVAWSLIMGLARRLGGAGRLPAASPRRAQAVTAQRALAQENSYCVYGNEALSWSSLRSVLCLSLPELDRSGDAPRGDGDYCLDRPGAFEVRVESARAGGAGGFVPYALRARGAEDWLGVVYRFQCLPQRSEPAAQRVGAQLRAAACLLADVVGGVVLDGDGFPLVGAGMREVAAAGR